MQKFVDAFNETQARLEENDIDGAVEGYKQMLTAYNNIAGSDLDQIHKELAYDQLTKTYQAIQNPPSSIHATTHVIAAAVLLVLFSFLVFFKPTIFGLTSLTTMITNVHELNWAFTESETRNVHLDAIPRSLSISGKVDGEGFVRVYAVTPYERVLLFDNDLVRINNDGTFEMACVNTCNTGLESKDFALEVVLQNAALTIYSLEYEP